MDFLDPRKRRAHSIRLMIGYVLIAIAIGLSTVILVYAAYGYGLNTKTGQIVQNGLLFVDSQPTGAEIFLNNADRNITTNARLVLPSNTYTLTIKKSGYHDWQRDFTLDEHSVERYVYPLLFPVKPVTTNLKTYSALPSLVTQSPNQRWLLVQLPGDGAKFDEYDTTNLTAPTKDLSLPAGILTGSDQTNPSLTVIQWASNNNQVLLRHDFDGNNEFIIFDRNDPAASINLNKVFGSVPNQVALRNSKTDQLYFFDPAQQTLRIADVGKAAVAAPFLKHVIAFKPYGADLIDYITTDSAKAGTVNDRIWDKTKSYPLTSLPLGDKYLLDIASYQGTPYVVAGSSGADRVIIYKNPLPALKDPAAGKAIPLLALNVKGATFTAFSANARFIGVQNDASFGVYDLETQRVYSYQLAATIDGPLSWMDGHRWIGSSGGTVFVMDYDQTNQQLLTPTLQATGGLFSADYNHMLTLAKDGDSVTLQNVDMRAGTDLPKNLQQ